MQTDLLADSPEVANLKARNRELRQRLRQQIAAMRSLRAAIVTMHNAMEEVGEGVCHGTFLEEDEAKHDASHPAPGL